MLSIGWWLVGARNRKFGLLAWPNSACIFVIVFLAIAAGLMSWRVGGVVPTATAIEHDRFKRTRER